MRHAASKGLTFFAAFCCVMHDVTLYIAYIDKAVSIVQYRPVSPAWQLNFGLLPEVRTYVCGSRACGYP